MPQNVTQNFGFRLGGLWVGRPVCENNKVVHVYGGQGA